MQLSVASGQWSVLNESQAPLLSSPSSCLGTHLGAKLSLGNRNVAYGLLSFEQSRALRKNKVPKQELGNQKKKQLPTDDYP
jgi:hypothetical protein